MLLGRPFRGSGRTPRQAPPQKAKFPQYAVTTVGEEKEEEEEEEQCQRSGEQPENDDWRKDVRPRRWKIVLRVRTYVRTFTYVQYSTYSMYVCITPANVAQCRLFDQKNMNQASRTLARHKAIATQDPKNQLRKRIIVPALRSDDGGLLMQLNKGNQ